MAHSPALQRKRLLAFARALSGRGDDAEDLTQEALLRACRQRKLEQEGDLFPWLRKVVRNLLIDRLRRGARVRFQSLDGLSFEPAAELRSPEQQGEDAELLERLRAAMQSLPDDERKVFCLFYEQQSSIREISEQVGSPSGTIKSWLHRARERLRAQLAEEDCH